jgi:hypothetical protein
LNGFSVSTPLSRVLSPRQDARESNLASDTHMRQRRSVELRWISFSCNASSPPLRANTGAVCCSSRLFVAAAFKGG